MVCKLIKTKTEFCICWTMLRIIMTTSLGRPQLAAISVFSAFCTLWKWLGEKIELVCSAGSFFGSHKNHSTVSAHTNKSTGIWTVAWEDKVASCSTPFSNKKMIRWYSDLPLALKISETEAKIVSNYMGAWIMLTGGLYWCAPSPDNKPHFYLFDFIVLNSIYTPPAVSGMLSSILQAKNNTVSDSHPSAPPTVCRTHPHTHTFLVSLFLLPHTDNNNNLKPCRLFFLPLS